jgi:hypothetical protein
MPESTPITFVIAVNSQNIFQNNFMASPCFRGSHPHQVLVQTGFPSAAKAYNDAIDRSTNDLIVFAHQDILFPETWLSDLRRALDSLQETDPRWGVLGCYGEALQEGGRGYIYSGGLGIMGKPFNSPAPVQTLDEIVLILKKSTGLRFDEDLPNFHFYGADICMAAAAQGLSSYAISAFCIHNTEQYFVLPKEFYQSYRYMKRKWKKFLPIQTTCVRMTGSDLPMYLKRIREVYLRFVRRKSVSAMRLSDGGKLLNELGQISGNAEKMGAESAKSAPR